MYYILHNYYASYKLYIIVYVVCVCVCIYNDILTSLKKKKLSGWERPLLPGLANS